jgi:hypothetical protein
LKAVSAQRPTIGAPLASTASTSSNDCPDGAASSGAGCHSEPNSDATVLDYDDMNVKFAQLGAKLDRLRTAVQKGPRTGGREKRDGAVDPTSAWAVDG